MPTMIMLTLTLSQVLDDVYRLVVPTLLTLLCGWLVRKYGTKLDADTQARLQATLQEHALNAVSLVYQRTVKDLKNPTKPGAFDDAAKAAALREATSRVERVAKDIVDALVAPGQSRSEVITQVIERAVVELESKTHEPPADGGTIAP